MKKRTIFYLFLLPFYVMGQQTMPQEKLQKVIEDLAKTYKIPSVAVRNGLGRNALFSTADCATLTMPFFV